MNVVCLLAFGKVSIFWILSGSGLFAELTFNCYIIVILDFVSAHCRLNYDGGCGLVVSYTKLTMKQSHILRLLNRDLIWNNFGPLDDRG